MKKHIQNTSWPFYERKKKIRNKDLGSVFLRFDLGPLAGPLLSVKGKMADLGGRDGGNSQDAERTEVSNRTLSLDLSLKEVGARTCEMK